MNEKLEQLKKDLELSDRHDLLYQLDEVMAELLDKVEMYIPQNSRAEIYNEYGITLPELSDPNTIS